MSAFPWTEALEIQVTKVITLAPRFLIKNNLAELYHSGNMELLPKIVLFIEPGRRLALTGHA